MQLTVPAQIGKYEILGEIGHGGMATVYRARDTRLNRMVALKVMHPHLRGATEARVRFAREAVTVARLRHPNILEIYDYSGEDDAGDVSYIATELLTGPTLKQFAEQHTDIPAEVAACFVIAVARALSAAHSEGVVHRDVKPENVLLHEARTVKLTDFGIAQLIDAQSMTTTGTVLGSPGHMAPEQVEGKECDARSDIFALGTVLYLLATGRLPYTGRNPHQVLKAIVDGNYVDPQHARPSIGGQLRAILLRAMNRDPDLRYQTATAFADDLTKFVAQVGITDPVATLAEYLADPAAFTTSFRLQLIDRLTVAGEAAVSSGDVPRAFDFFNRVLAFDDGNPRVLAALERLDRRSRLRRLSVIAAAVTLVALGVIVVVLAARHHVHDPSIASVTASASSTVAPPEGTSPTPVAVAVVADARAVNTAGAETPAARDEALVTPVETVTNSRARTSRTAARVQEGDGTSPRRVVFQPNPANVSIGVDGAAPVPFGPSFREITLAPGEHTFKVVGAHDCCVDAEFTQHIPSGPGVTNLPLRLKYRPAVLYVASNVPADVRVGDGLAEGRSRAVFDVPLLRAMRETHTIVVIAPGYREHRQDVAFNAGQLANVAVQLVPTP